MANILVVGDALLDLWVLGKIKKYSSELGYPKPVIQVTDQVYTLGGAANVAMQVLSQKDSVTLMTVMGEDATSKRLVSMCQDKGIRLVCFPEPTRTTPLKVRVVYDDSIRYDIEDPKPVTNLIEKWMVETLMVEIPKHDTVLVSDYSKGCLTPPVFYEIAKAKISIADPKDCKTYPYYKGFTVLKLNMSDVLNHDLLEYEAAAKIISMTGSTLVVTKGAKGISVWQDAKTDISGQQFPAPKIELNKVRGACGAGDCVLACLGSQLAKGRSIEQAAAKAVELAAAYCSSEDPW